MVRHSQRRSRTDRSWRNAWHWQKDSGRKDEYDHKEFSACQSLIYGPTTPLPTSSRNLRTILLLPLYIVRRDVRFRYVTVTFNYSTSGDETWWYVGYKSHRHGTSKEIHTGFFRRWSFEPRSWLLSRHVCKMAKTGTVDIWNLSWCTYRHVATWGRVGRNYFWKKTTMMKIILRKK